MYYPLFLFLAIFYFSGFTLAKPLPYTNFPKEWPAEFESLCPALPASTLTSHITKIEITTLAACSTAEKSQISDKTVSDKCQPNSTLTSRLRHHPQAPATISGLYRIYTDSLHTIITDLPDHVSRCDNPSELSSLDCPDIKTMAMLPIEKISSIIPNIRNAPIQTELDCQPDNCLRQLEKASSIVAPFCLTYTTSLYTYTIGFPKDIANCAANTIAISSACSCIMAAVLASPTSEYTVPIATTRTEFQTTTVLYTSTITPSPTLQVTNPVPLVKSLDCQADNCLRAMERGFPAIAPFCARYTGMPHQPSILPAEIVNCEGQADAISSACSCVMQPSTSPTSTTAAVPVETELGGERSKSRYQEMEQGNWSGVDNGEHDQHGANGDQNQRMTWWNWWMKKPASTGSGESADDFVNVLEETLGQLLG